MDAEFPTEQIVPLGLIVNELVTNAAKHGSGDIKVKLERSPSKGYLLMVSDQGTSLPQGFDPAAAHGLGMKVVQALAQQLVGKLRIDVTERSKGTKFSVQFGDHRLDQRSDR